MNFVGFDLETASRDQEHPEYALMPWTVKTKGSEITLSCAYFMGKSRVESHLLPTTLRDLRALKKPVATWNGIFDLAFLYASDISIRGIHWIDAMNLWKFLDNGQDMPMSWSLKAGAKKFLKDWPKLKDFLELKEEDLPDPSDPYWRERVIMDAEATALIAEAIWPQLTPQQQNLAKIQSVSLPMMAKSWVNGIRIDIDAVHAARPEIIRNMTTQELKLGLLEPGSTEDNYTPSKVLRSPDKLRKLLYEDYGLPCTRYTDGGKSGNQKKSTDKAALTYLADVDDRVQEILIWRKYNTILSKFINTPIEACDFLQSDVTHAAPRVFATYTGRGSFSSKVGKKKVGVALHQLPRGKEVRAYILPTQPDHFVVEFDVMAQEARWMAIMANDPVMQQLFNSPAPFNDIHSYMGAQLLGVSFEEFLRRKAAHDPEIVGAHGGRNLGKFINLSYNYRISPAAARVKAKVDYNLDASLQQTTDWKTKFTQAYQGIPQYWQMAPKVAQAQGYSETAAGRRYKLSHWQDMNWATSSSAINQPIQGSSADQKELALAVLATQMPDLEDRLMLEMHDAIHLSIPGGYSMRFLQKANRILDEINYEKYWGYKPPVSFPWEGSLGPNEGSKIEFGYNAEPSMTIAEFYERNKE